MVWGGEEEGKRSWVGDGALMVLRGRERLDRKLKVTLLCALSFLRWLEGENYLVVKGRSEL